MFNLPSLTVAVLIGMPAFWVLYTLVFLWVSRGWDRDDYSPEGDR
jgi:hypothetical protein